jgi:LytR cell envelope-related transcriptional attenuator
VEVDAPFLTSRELIRPWRRATFLVAGVAVVELLVIVGAGVKLLAKPVSHAIQQEAVSVATPKAASTPEPKALKQAIHRMHAPAGEARPRGHLRIMVFNGNGRSGAAGSEASRLSHLGYKIAGATNASHQDYATSVVMYRPGYRSEGLRLAKDLGVRVVGPLDGIAVSALDGGQLAVVVGAR